MIAEQHPLCLGSVGLSPVVDAENMRLVHEADLIVMAGFDPIELRDAWLDAWPEAQAVISLDWGPLNHRIFPEGERAYGDTAAHAGAAHAGARSGQGRVLGPRAWPQLRDAVAHIVRPRTRPRASARRRCLRR